MPWRCILALTLTIPLLAMAGEPRAYIVELRSDPAQESHEAILAEQQRVRAELDKLGVRVVESTSATSNTLLVEMPEELAPKVRTLPGVKRVRASRTLRRR